MADQPLKGLHAVGYCRVSTDDMGQTNETQKRLIDQWAEAQGVIIDAYYMDELSGAIFPRPQLATALLTLATSSASMLVCYDQSRLTRNAPEHIPLINQILGDKVVRYVTNGDMAPDSLGARVINAIKGETDKEERAKLHARTREALKTRKDRGQHVGRPARLIICADTSSLPKGLIASSDGSTIHGKARQVDTRVLSPSEALNFARAGLTPYKVSIMLGISPSTFDNALKNANIKAQYYAILKGAGE